MPDDKKTAGNGEVPLTVSRPELLVNGSDRDFRRFIHSLFAFFARCEIVRNNYAEHVGLPGPHYSILLCIRHLNADGPVNVKTVAAHLRLSGSFVATETGKLEELGLLSKAQAPTDRRQTMLIVTEKGCDLLDQLAPMQRQVNDVQFSCLTQEQFRTLIPLVGSMVDCCDQAIALQGYLQLGSQPSPAGRPIAASKGRRQRKRKLLDEVVA